MLNKIAELEYLIDSFNSLPGVGRKTAVKWVNYLMSRDQRYINEFAQRLLNAKKKVIYCQQCNNFSVNSICDICQNVYRNRHELCVVSYIEELQRIEESGKYNGLYFVLHGECDIKKSVEKLPSFDKLVKILDNSDVKDLIIATNFTIPGQATAIRLQKTLTDFNGKIYRIGLGLPLNGALDYADDETIKYAFINKNKIKG